MLALFLALASPELEVRGITASYGNTVVENAYRNTVEILRRAGRRLTLGVGARRPLKRPLATAHETHGDSGLGDAAVPPAGGILGFLETPAGLLADQRQAVPVPTLCPAARLGPRAGSAPGLRPGAGGRGPGRMRHSPGQG